MTERLQHMLSSFLSVICLLILCGCSTIHLNTVPLPPPTAKLRVYVQPLSANTKDNKPIGKRRNWGVSSDEFKENQLDIAREYLEDTGYYEVVSEDDVKAALSAGDEEGLTRTLMESNDWAFAKEIGRALRADYVMVMERAKQSGALGETDFVFTNVLINVANGKKYDSHFRFTRNIGAAHRDRRRGIRATYRDIFRNAKEDMLTTAMRKADLLKDVNTTQTGTQPAPHLPTRTAPQGEEAQEPLKPDWTAEVNGETGLVQAAPARGAPKLVVYDLEASGQYKPAALIITEALREEIYRLKNFVLVNRENLEQLLKEMALQQTGLIDEKEAVKTGKGLAANQVVTGRIGLLGKTFVLQAKRIDVESFATLGLSSAKFEQGREDSIFQQLPDFAKHLSGL